jgi:RsiW-degrading membrane proteinase PrsW (M82 family)
MFDASPHDDPTDATLYRQVVSRGWPSLFYAVLALLPAMLLLAWLYTRDTLHPEPKRAVYRMFLRGAAIVLPAGLIERMLLGTSAGQGRSDGLQTVLLTAFFAAGMVEEFLKAAIVERGALQRGWMKTPMDCLVYAGAAALGFASVENILYVTSAGWDTALLRAVTAVPAHLMFGIAMGWYFSESLFSGRSRARAYLIPALLHGAYDTFALSNSLLADALLVAYLVALLEWSLRRIDRAQPANGVSHRVS